MFCRQHDCANGNYLENHLRFTQSRRGNRKSFCGCDVAKSQNHDLAPDDNHRHPGVHQMHFPEGNECGRHQEFIRNGIEQNPERRDFAAPPSIIPIRPVRGRSQKQNEHTPNRKVNRHAKEHNIGCAGQKDNDQHRNKEDAQNREAIW